MSNPTITRLGKTQFWYKYYYSDFSYSNIYKKLYTFENLLNSYLMYGIHSKVNIFYHNFWYKNIFKNKKPLNTLNSALYFRKYYYAHKTLTIEHSYSIRLKTTEFFTLKLYILKYNNWIITSIQWFKPLKNNPNKHIFKKNSPHLLLLNTNKGFTGANKRSTLILSLLLKTFKFSNFKINYNF